MATLVSEKEGKPHYRICLLGASLATGNRGVSALCASLVRLLWEVRADADIALFIGARSPAPQRLVVGSQARQLHVVPYRLSLRAGLTEHLFFIFAAAMVYHFVQLDAVRAYLVKKVPALAALVHADMVGEIRGGDSFSDIYGFADFLLGTLPLIVALLVRRDVILLPQTYGPYKSLMARLVAKYVLMSTCHAFARDRRSQVSAHDLAAGRRVIGFCPDVAFALDARWPSELEVLPPMRADDLPSVVGINVNGLMYNGGYTRNNMFGLSLDYPDYLDRLLRAILETTNLRILLIPHTYAPRGNVNSDPEASEKVLRRVPEDLRGRVHMVAGIYDQHEIKAIIGRCAFFVGSRMHACIAALSQNVPTVGVAYSEKFYGVFDSIGVGGWVIDARQAQQEQALRTVLHYLDQREAMRTSLEGKVAKVNRVLRQVFETLVLGT